LGLVSRLDSARVRAVAIPSSNAKVSPIWTKSGNKTI
jgi:hypothetical protein